MSSVGALIPVLSRWNGAVMRYTDCCCHLAVFRTSSPASCCQNSVHCDRAMCPRVNACWRTCWDRTLPSRCWGSTINCSAFRPPSTTTQVHHGISRSKAEAPGDVVARCLQDPINWTLVTDEPRSLGRRSFAMSLAERSCSLFFFFLREHYWSMSSLSDAVVGLEMQ